MDALEVFLPRHARLHGADPGEPRSVWDRMLEGLSDEQIRLRPARGVNSIAWIVWHIARVEDVAVNLVVAAGRQGRRQDPPVAAGAGGSGEWNEKSRITTEPRGLAPQQNCARAADAKAGASTATSATASTSTSQTTLMIAPLAAE